MLRDTPVDLEGAWARTEEYVKRAPPTETDCVTGVGGLEPPNGRIKSAVLPTRTPYRRICQLTTEDIGDGMDEAFAQATGTPVPN
jgi:hypothetical protein